MPLTREFIETIKKRADRSKAFRVGMLKEAATAFVTNDPQLGRTLLGDYVRCTLGFEELAKRMGVKSPSVKRMLSVKGNPGSNSLALIMGILQEHEGVELNVTSKSQSKRTLENA